MRSAVDDIARWAERQSDVRALAFGGSRLRGTHRPDSDIDLVLLSQEPRRYTEGTDWLDELGPAELVRTQRWGVMTQCRLALADGIEIDLAIGTPAWAAVDPVDPGTRRVVSDGIEILVDPDSLLATLVAACTIRLDHVQIAAPPDCERAARRFFGELIGLRELEKPEPLRSRGGVWFELGEQQLHVGVEARFSPALKAHPAIRVSASSLDALAEGLVAAGTEVAWDDSLPGERRFYAQDPWGNRIEFLAATEEVRSL